MKIFDSWPAARAVTLLGAGSAIVLASAGAWAQSASGTGPATGVVPADASGKPTIVNTHFTYPGIELWDPSKWPIPKAQPIAQWIETHQMDSRPEYVVKDKYKGITEWVGNPDYNWKSDSIRDQAVIDALAHMGLHAEIREGGGLQVTVTPEKVLADKDRKVPVVIVPYVISQWDPFWAMNTLEHFKKYNQLLAQRGDFILDYFVLDKSLAGVGQSAQGNGGPSADLKRIYLDVSMFAEQGAKIASVPGLEWSDDSGKKIDPDQAVEHMGSITVLNMAGKTSSGPGFSLGPRYRGQFPGIKFPFNAQHVIYSPLGQHWMEGISVAHRYPMDNDPGLKAHFEQMGLVGGEHDYKGVRYFLYSPRLAVEQGTKLPLVIVNSGVSYLNQSSLSNTYGAYLDYFRLAAKGDINVLAIGLGSGDKLDTDAELVREVEKTSPIDPSRVYVTGHSAMGHASREFAYRHPEIIAAVAQLGNASGFAAPAYSHEAVIVDDARVEAWSKIDMPDITIGAAGEVLSPHTMPSLIMPDYNLFIEAWQRRLKAQRAPIKSREQIMVAEHSSDHVTRLFGLPNDGSSLEVLDGYEHYIIDIKNIDGRKHLRVVGVQNMFHTVEPTMPMLSWSWMRRFARDQTNGKVIELY
jgi:hypothetical protein